MMNINQRRVMSIVIGMVATWAVAGLTAPARAQVKLNGIFSNHMVLQRGVKLPVYGTAEAGEEVTVVVGSQTAKATAGADGRFRVEFEPMEAGGPISITVNGKSNSIMLQNVMIGDVWLCGGQSNMVMGLGRSTGGAEAAAAANLPGIRLVMVGNPVRSEPQVEVTGGVWQECNSGTASGFSAVGFHFGRVLHEHLKVPIGLIQCANSGSVAESWTSRESMVNDDELKRMVELVDKDILKYLDQRRAYPAKFRAWWEEAKKADAAGDQLQPRPGLRNDVRNDSYRPYGFYNGGIAPLGQFPIKGVIWYQGESNGGFAYQYRKLFPTLIAAWRKNWNQPDMPFLFVQLPTYLPNEREPNGASWAELREAQLMTWQNVPNTGMAVTIDCGELPDAGRDQTLHPRNKKPVGERLALAARAVAYGEKIEYSGPIYDSMAVDGDKVRIKFTHMGGGLVVKGDKLEAFKIAGADQKFVPAQAQLDGDTVVVSSPDVPQPVAVRYNWEYLPHPTGNLYNKIDLPASPFRTDDWPGLTAKTKWWWSDPNE